MAISTAVDLSAVARVLGIATKFVNLQGGIFLLPQRVALVGQGNSAAVYDTTKRQITSASEAASLYGFGSPIHLSVLQLLPVNGDGIGTIPLTVYPLVDDGSGVASTGDITPGGAQTIAAAYRVNITNIYSEQFVISSGDSVATIVTAMTAAINAVLEMPVIAVDATPGISTQVDLTSKWKGASANDMNITVEGSTTAGTTFAFTQMSGGLVNPNIDSALAQVGDIWETMFLNCMELGDTVTLDKYSVFGEGRWGALTRKPMIAFTGTSLTGVTAATAVSDVRKTDRTNAQLVEPGGVDLAFIIASRQLARIVKLANNNPPHDYGSQKATGLTPGVDGDQWDYTERDVAVKAGSSTIEVKDGVVEVSDTITFYHPAGEPVPAYRFVVDIVKLQNILFNLDLIFATDEWNGAPLIPDNQPTVNATAKKPKMAVAEVANMLDSLGLNAIISDPETAKKNTLAAINETNPKRLDLVTTIQLSGNTNIISVDLNFGFFFGTAQVVA